MSTLQTEVFEAFRSLGIDEEKSLKAAAALGRRDLDLAEVKRDVSLLKYGQAVNLALSVAILVKLFLP